MATTPNPSTVSPAVVGGVALIVLAVAGWLLWPKPLPVSNTNITDSIACPRDAQLCPDGTSVGRSGPNCTFDPCPVDNTNAVSNANTNLNQNTNTDVILTDDWELYTNDELQFSLKLPPGWEVDQNRTTDEEIVLTDGAELAIRESIKSTSTTQTLEEWTFVYQGEPNYTVSDYRLDGHAAKRVRYGDGSDLIGVKNDGQLIVVTVGRMETNGMLATLNLLP